jgi:hypothetical protein
MTNTLPGEINILGVVYKILYIEKPSDVDVFKRDALWGQCDYWTRTIRVYIGHDRSHADILQTLLHEIIHAIGEKLHIESLKTEENNLVDLIAMALTDTLIRNDLIKWEDK